MRALLAALALLATAACAPTIQRAGVPEPAFTGPRIEADALVSHDGARLGLTSWQPSGDQPVRAVVIALHGMNDYARAWELAGPAWAAQGIATYAYDARGFGRSPGRGVWAGEALLAADLRAAVQAVRARHPGVPLVLAGESMGAATIMTTLAAPNPPAVDRVLLLAPAVWGWSNLPLPYSATLWVSARFAGPSRVSPPRAVTRRIQATDNIELLRRLGRDPLMTFETRIDAVYGLVRLMERAYDGADRLPPGTLFAYGANDQIIPPQALANTIARLPRHVRVVRYPDGWHMLTRDLQAGRLFGDAAAFIADPGAPLPSGLDTATQQPGATAR